MFIRSQNKLLLVDINNLIIAINKNSNRIVCRSTSASDNDEPIRLGEYNEVDRMIEILDDIQKDYNMCGMYGTYHVFEMPER